MGPGRRRLSVCPSVRDGGRVSPPRPGPRRGGQTSPAQLCGAGSVTPARKGAGRGWGGGGAALACGWRGAWGPGTCPPPHVSRRGPGGPRRALPLAFLRSRAVPARVSVLSGLQATEDLRASLPCDNVPPKDALSLSESACKSSLVAGCH